MSPDDDELERVLGAKVLARERIGGGCIADAQRVDLVGGGSRFLKLGPSPEMEANGLRTLAAAKTVRVPEVIHVGDSFLVLEYIERGRSGPRFMEIFGRQFAELHRSSDASFGFFEDNLIGRTPQRNLPRGESWVDFYWTHRLEPQIRWAADKGGDLGALPGQLEVRLPGLLAGSEEAPALLHGDLWGGNFMCGADGQPVLIDPAAYYGHREADLGMTYLFGGFSPAFYAAYEEAHPLPPQANERIPVYMLYHVLNHFNLFGGGYLSQARSIMAGLV